MKRQFAEMLERNTPKPNSVIMEGLATRVIPYAEQYLNENFKDIAKNFPEGLEYLGSERCSPEEEYAEVTRSRSNKFTFDLARSSIYLVKYLFRYMGENLPPKYLYLPYVEDGGVMFNKGSMYHISPMLTDYAIAPDRTKIFVRLMKVKLNFESQYHIYVVDGETTQVKVIYGNIYNKSKADKSASCSNAKTCNMHYLLAKYGFKGMFEKYLGFVPVIGKDEINHQNYPDNEWVICESTRIKPSELKGKFYIPTNIKLAIPRKEWNDNVSTIIGSFFYIVDYFPDQIEPDWVDSANTWIFLLGNIIFGSDYGKGRLYELIQKHLKSLDQYLDDSAKVNISKLGYNVKDFYDLLFVILKNFNVLLLDSVEKGNDLYNRNFEILYYLTHYLIKNFTKMNYELDKRLSKKKGKPLEKKNVNKILSKWFKMKCILSINYDNKIVNGINYSGDNKYPKITAVCGVQQSSDNGGPGRGKSTRNVVDNSKHLHVSSIEIGSLLALSKSNPAPAFRTNMFVNVSVPDGKIIRNEKYKELLDEVQEDLKRRTNTADGIDVIDVDDVDTSEDGAEEEPIEIVEDDVNDSTNDFE